MEIALISAPDDGAVGLLTAYIIVRQSSLAGTSSNSR